jgi:hypothetical protein
MTTILQPRTIHHPDLGQLILVHGIPAEPLEGLRQSGALRTILHEGHRYVVRAELEAYSPTDIEDLINLDAIVEIGADSTSDRLHEAVQDQADTDMHHASSRARFIQRVHDALKHGPTTNPFAATLEWPTIWSDAAQIAVNMAGDVATAQMAQAHQNLATAWESGDVDTETFAAFHRTLLALAAPELEKRFSEIWQPVYGLLAVPSDVASRTMVLAVLRRLVALFSGHRGNPEGSETPSQVMGDYLALVQARKQG